ncbi:hypothetical protein [Massilia sp. H6]|uniref:hypothetical protein n=1 Tax=Massilia sp. H6 TaxID=2970464 RepID=UPI002169BBBE|nr:hypothetical protein [Massilia sp. H6]UVW27587.1 hypothetical protein NRS07_13650 [Massilia sp. H6]
MRTLLAFVIFTLLMVGCNRLPVVEQARMLGQREFTQQSWAIASQVERGKMLASFLTKHPADELTAERVKQLLGTPTGYADYDEDPAYVVGPPTVESKYGKGHLLIFVTDKKTGRVLKTRLVPKITK